MSDDHGAFLAALLAAQNAAQAAYLFTAREPRDEHEDHHAPPEYPAHDRPRDEAGDNERRRDLAAMFGAARRAPREEQD